MITDFYERPLICSVREKFISLKKPKQLKNVKKVKSLVFTQVRSAISSLHAFIVGTLTHTGTESVGLYVAFSVGRAFIMQVS